MNDAEKWFMVVVCSGVEAVVDREADKVVAEGFSPAEYGNHKTAPNPRLNLRSTNEHCLVVIT